jgi:hypothetical protein
MEKIVALLLLPVVYAAAFGWGRQVERHLYKTPLGSSAYSVALGLVAWLLVGAFLNHLSLALPLALDVILVVGLVLAVMEWRSHAFSMAGLRPGLNAVPALIALSCGAFFAWYLLPAGGFNHHDDFYKYLPRVIRMLQIGTLSGNPFDFVGIDSLGMQSFLQGFFIGHLPFYYLNAFDAVFCMVLAALLLDALGRQLQIGWAIRSLAVACLLIINPQYVNISALYSAIAMIIALSMASFFMVRNLDTSSSARVAKAAVPVGLFAAAIAGLKVTLIPYAGAYLLVLLLLMLIRSGTRRRTLPAALSAGSAALVLAGAWAALSSDKLIGLFDIATRKLERFAALPASTDSAVSQTTGPLHSPAGEPGIQCRLPDAENASYLHEVVTKGDLFYGGHIYQYLGLASLIAAMGLFAVVLLYRRPSQQLVLLPAAAAGIAAIVSIIGVTMGVYGIHVNALVRYNTPVFVAVLPVLGLLLFAATRRHDEAGRRSSPTILSILVILLTLAAPSAAFASLWMERAQQAIDYRHILAYSTSTGESYQTNLSDAFSDRTRDVVKSVQGRLPVGTSVLVWMPVPFHLDFARNQVLTLASPGSFDEITGIPDAMRPLWLQQQLQDAGVEYVFWEYRGLREQRGGATLAALRETLAKLADLNPVGYRNANWVLFSVK